MIEMKKEITVLAIMFLVVLVSGCASQPEPPLTEIGIPGHGNQVYTFANDIRESLKVPAQNAEGIKQIGNDFTVMNIVFNGANTTENAYTRVVLFDMLSKMNVYYANEGKYIAFNTFYFVGDQWYFQNGSAIPQPTFTAPVIRIISPSEAAGTFVKLEDDVIYVSGTDYRNLSMAGDKLTLLFFGIDEV